MESNKLTATIIIPFYNGKYYIFEAIESIKKQKRLVDEIIIVDDGTDNSESLNILHEVEMKYADIKVIHQKNKGISGAMTAGAKMACGDIIFQFDYDDVLHNNYVNLYMKIFEQNSEVDAVTCQYASFFEGKDYTKRENIHDIYKPRGLIVPDIFFENCGGGANSAYRKKSIENIGFWDERFTSYQDWGLWLKFLEYDLNLQIIPQILYYYRIREDSELRTTAINFDLEKNIDISINRIMSKRKDKYDIASIIRKSYNLIDRHTQKIINQKTIELKKKNYQINQKTIELKKKNQQIQQLKNSKSFQLGNLFFRSVKNPYKWITFPYNFIKILLKK